MIILFDAPEDIVSLLQEKEPYIIKLKCIACSETRFVPFKKPIVNNSNSMLTIGESSYPLNLIEYVVVRYKNNYGTFSMKTEETYKVKASHLQTLLNEQALQELKKFGLK